MPALEAARDAQRARSEQSEVTLREYYRRRAANQPSMEPASTAAQRPQPPQAVHFSPKHTYSAMHSFRAGHSPSPTKQLAGHAAEEAGGGSPRGTIAAFRPGDPAPARSHSLRPQPASPARTKSYSQLAQLVRPPASLAPPPLPHAHTDCPAELLSPGEACASPEPAPSELSTVHRAINAAIASSVECLMCTPPELASWGAETAAQRVEQQQAQAAQPRLEAAPEAELPPSVSGGGAAGDSADLVSISPFGYLPKGGRPPRASTDAAPQGAGMPVPPPDPAHPPPPTMSESFALELKATLSPTFMSARSKPMICELDDPGSGIRFPKNRRGGRLQRLVGRLKSCFVPQPDCELSRASSATLARPGQSPSPQLPRLAIPLEPLRRSVAGLSGAAQEAAGPAPLAGQQLQQGAAAAAPAAAPPAAGGRQSPPQADLLGLYGEASDVVICIASPQLPSHPGSCFASQCATPADQLVASNLVSAGREGGLAGLQAAPASQQAHAKRNLMEVLHSRAEGFGACGPSAPAPTAAVPPGLPPVAEGSAAAAPGTAAGAEGEAVAAPQAAEARQPGGSPASEGAVPASQTAAAPPAGLQGSRGAAQPQPARVRSRKVSPIKSPVKHTIVSISQLLAKRRSSPGSARKRQQAATATVRAVKAGGSPGRPRQAALASKALLAQRQLDAAKAAAGRRQRPTQPAGGARAAAAGAVEGRAEAGGGAPGKRDLSRPAYRSAALHAMLSPAKAAKPRHGRSQSTSVPARQLPKFPGAASAPVSPFKAGCGAGGAHQAAASTPSSPTSYAQLTQPAIPPRMNKAAAVRTAAAQRKLRAKQQPATAAHAASLGCAGSTECLLPAAAPSGPMHRLASPLHTARPGYVQRSGTPTATLPVFELGEAGVEPYSVQPAGRGAAAGSAVGAASAPDSPLSLKKYQADRAQYLQMLSQLAMGMEVPAQQIVPHKQPTPPPLPLSMLAAAEQGMARQAGGDGNSGAVTVRARLGAAAAAGSQQEEAGGRAGLRMQQNVLNEEEDCGSVTTRQTLVYSLAPAASSGSSELGEGSLTPHSNDLFGQEVTSPGGPDRCLQQMVSLQKMVSLSAAAAQRGRSAAEEEWSLPGGAPRYQEMELGGTQPARRPTQVARSAESVTRTDVSGGGGAVAFAAGGETVSKPQPSQWHASGV